MGGVCANIYYSNAFGGTQSFGNFHNDVLKCPSGHFLAFYETAKCANRHKNHHGSSGQVSCLECDYALC